MPRPLLSFSQSDYLIQVVDTQIHTLNLKQCRSRSVGFHRSQLVWIYTVYKDRVYPGSAGLGLTDSKTDLFKSEQSRQVFYCISTVDSLSQTWISQITALSQTVCCLLYILWVTCYIKLLLYIMECFFFFFFFFLFSPENRL